MSILAIMATIKGIIGIIIGILGASLFRDTGFRSYFFCLMFLIGSAFSTIAVIILLLVVRRKGAAFKKAFVVPIIIIFICMDLIFFGITYLENTVKKYNNSYVELLNDKIPYLIDSEFIKENQMIQNWLESLDK